MGQKASHSPGTRAGQRIYGSEVPKRCMDIIETTREALQMRYQFLPRDELSFREH